MRLVDEKQADLLLHVSNQSFEHTRVRLTVAVDGVTVVDGDFHVEDQHNWVSRFASTETGANAPRASVLWVPRLGQQSFDTVLSDSISDRTSVGVNVANGNLLVRTTDVQVAGTGQDLDVDRTYNSLGDKYGTNAEGVGAGALGPGWTSAITGDLWLEPMLKHGSQAFHGPGGMVVPFERVNSSHGTDGWDGPPAMSASLEADDTTYNAYTLKLKKKNAKYRFLRPEGAGAYFTRVIDRNDNAIKVSGTRAAGYKRTEVTDTQGRTLTNGFDASFFHR